MNEKTRAKKTTPEKTAGFIVITSNDCALGRRGAVVMASPENVKKQTDAKRARPASDNDLKIAGLGAHIAKP